MFGFAPSKPEFAVIGLGRFGASLAMALQVRGHHVLGIDSDQDVAQDLASTLTRVVVLDSTDEQSLRNVDIAAFDTVIVAIGTNFEANLMTTSVLRDIGVQNIICKAVNERQKHILERIGAHRVILPEHEAGQRLARELCMPWLEEQVALGAEHSMMQIHPPRGMVGCSLHEADLRRRFNVMVVSITRGGSLTVMPSGEFQIAADDILSIIGKNDGITRMMDALR